MIKLILALSISLYAGSLDSLMHSGAKLKLLGIWAHPDDETAFMGAVTPDTNIEIVALNLKDGRDEQCLSAVVDSLIVYSRGCPCPLGITYCPELMGPFRLERMAVAKKVLGFKNRFFPIDSLIRTRDTAVAVDSLYKWIRGYKPDIIITHNWAGDYVSSITNANKRDHALVYEMVYSAIKRLSYKPAFFVSVYGYRNTSGNLLQATGIGAPVPTDSIDMMPDRWPTFLQAANYYDGSGFYLTVQKVGENYRKNWFHRKVY